MFIKRIGDNNFVNYGGRGSGFEGEFLMKLGGEINFLVLNGVRKRIFG